MRVMKTILLILTLLPLSLFACTGDCLTCHPNLLPTIEQDTRHKPMLGCIECHAADPNSMADCGSDCFACHPIEKIEKTPVEAHGVIRGCRDCHMALKKVLFGVDGPAGQSRQEPLKEWLLQ
jgi:hypothetical protein